MIKYTDEELSRILTAHEAGGLMRVGEEGNLAYPCCIVQAGLAVTRIASPASCISDMVTRGGWWFDGAYQQYWTTEEFLRQLEEKGLA